MTKTSEMAVAWPSWAGWRDVRTSPGPRIPVEQQGPCEHQSAVSIETATSVNQIVRKKASRNRGSPVKDLLVVGHADELWQGEGWRRTTPAGSSIRCILTGNDDVRHADDGRSGKMNGRFGAVTGKTRGRLPVPTSRLVGLRSIAAAWSALPGVVTRELPGPSTRGAGGPGWLGYVPYCLVLSSICWRFLCAWAITSPACAFDGFLDAHPIMSRY